MLCWKYKVKLKICEHCGTYRYEKKTLKGKGIANKVLIYFRAKITEIVRN